MFVCCPKLLLLHLWHFFSLSCPDSAATPGAGPSHLPMDPLDKIYVFPHKIVEPYRLTSTFSSLKFTVEKIKHDEKVVAIPLSTLFPNAPKIPEECKLNFKKCQDYESSLFFKICTSMLSSMCDEVVLNTKYSSLYYKAGENDMVPKNILLDRLGMGDRTVWYGEPDGRVRARLGAEEQSTTIVEIGPAEVESDGETVPVEAKVKVNSNNLPQAIGTAIVLAFIEHNHHKALNPMVPTILINGEAVVILFYNCEEDLLLLSEPIRYTEDDGWLVVWLVVNHR